MKNLFLSILIVFATVAANAQSIERSVIGSAGSEQKTSSIILSSTVGESAVQTLKNSSLIITQGFQQTSESDSDGDGGEDTTSILEMSEFINISLYPNPAYSSVNFIIKTNEILVLSVFDTAGKLVHSTEYTEQAEIEQTVQVQDWESGVYHFKFINTRQE